MTEDKIVQWMREKVQLAGFTDATSLAESFLKEHHINDALDAGFKVAQEIRDKELVSLAG
ncbi:MAG: hypothetical protein ACYSTR_04805 [Planctomycetota bacterium]|jgi:hypothetical protein